MEILWLSQFLWSLHRGGVPKGFQPARGQQCFGPGQGAPTATAAGRPDSRRPDFPASGCPSVQTSECPDVQASERLGTQMSILLTL